MLMPFPDMQHLCTYTLMHLLFKGDVLRMCLDPFGDQIGNELLNTVMETKLLELPANKYLFA